MLTIQLRRSLYNPTLWVPDLQVRFRVPLSGAAGASLICRIDTGADRPAISIDHAPAMGLTTEDVRRTGKKIKLNPIVGGPIDGYVLTVRHFFKDHSGGWMEWDGEVALYDGVREVLGLKGFMEFFDRVSLYQRKIELEPRRPLIGDFITWQCGQPAPPRIP